jgi:hypothetical protein
MVNTVGESGPMLEGSPPMVAILRTERYPDPPLVAFAGMILSLDVSLEL